LLLILTQVSHSSHLPGSLLQQISQHFKLSSS
jgi:hypothetical protein